MGFLFSIPGLISLFVIFILLPSVKQVNQYERGVRFRFGKFKDEMVPGWRIVWPIIESWQRIDIRVKAVDVPDQEAITKDNVSARVNAVIYYRISAAQKAVLEVEDFFYAVSQLAQTTMRNVIGETSLDDLLSKRNEVADKIQRIIDRATDPWGVKVESVELKDIILPDEMKRVIARQAEAERERRAKIINAEGEFQASEKLADAARVLSQYPVSVQLRFLQTLKEIATEQNSTIVFPVPIDLIEAFINRIGKTKEQ